MRRGRRQAARVALLLGFAACGGKIAEDGPAEATAAAVRPMKDAADLPTSLTEDIGLQVEPCETPVVPTSIVGFEPSVCAADACRDADWQEALPQCPRGRYQLTLDRRGCLDGVAGPSGKGTRCLADALAATGVCKRRESCLIVTLP